MDLERIPPPLEHRAQAVLCRSTGHGPGCLHPVDWHTGPTTPAPDCECCSWRKNEPRGRWVAGPLGLPVVEMEGRR